MNVCDHISPYSSSGENEMLKVSSGLGIGHRQGGMEGWPLGVLAEQFTVVCPLSRQWH